MDMGDTKTKDGNIKETNENRVLFKKWILGWIGIILWNWFPDCNSADTLNINKQYKN